MDAGDAAAAHRLPDAAEHHPPDTGARRLPDAAPAARDEPGLLAEAGRAPGSAIAWTVYLGALPTAVAFTTWAYALSRTTAGRLGATTFLVPPLAVLLGWVLLDEVPALLALLGGACCLVGVGIARSMTVPSLRLRARP